MQIHKVCTLTFKHTDLKQKTKLHRLPTIPGLFCKKECVCVCVWCVCVCVCVKTLAFYKLHRQPYVFMYECMYMCKCTYGCMYVCMYGWNLKATSKQHSHTSTAIFLNLQIGLFCKRDLQVYPKASNILIYLQQ